MSAGLKKMLEAICEDPGNQVLRDRYLTLVSELQDGEAKANHVLELADAMKDIEPDYALRLAYFVHQFQREWARPLLLVAEVFKNMGRLGKAEVIQNHIESLPKKKDNTFQPNAPQSGFPKDLSQSAKAQFDAEESIIASIEDLHRKKLIKKKEKKSPPPPIATHAANFSEEYSSYGGFDVSEASVVKPPPPMSSVGKGVPLPIFTESPVKQSVESTVAPTFVLDDDPSPADEKVEIPENPVIKPPKSSKKSKKAKKKKSPPPPAFVPSFDVSKPMSEPADRVKFEISNSFSESEEKPKQHSRNKNESELIENPQEVAGFIFDNDDKVVVDEVVPSSLSRKGDKKQNVETPHVAHVTTDLENAQDIGVHQKSVDHVHHRPKMLSDLFDYYFEQGFLEKAIAILEQSERFAASDHWWQSRMNQIQKVRDKNKAKALESEASVIPIAYEGKDVAEWEIFLDRLVKHGRIRKAHFEIYRKIQSCSDLVWARVAYAKLPKIWDQLGLRGFHWDEKEGVEGFRERLKERSLPKLSVIICGERP